MTSSTKRKLSHSNLIVLLFFLGVCVLAYGLLIPTLGYYSDDWPYAGINHICYLDQY